MKRITHIRDPIHGSIELSYAERDVVDSRFFQRLRHIKQLGFADLAFPGATHSRYSHGIGAMHVASRVFDALFRDGPLAGDDLARLRQTLRLAVLLHDLGHAPLSHATERMLPKRAQLKLPAWTGDGEGEQASHEDMTLLLMLASGLSDVIRTSFADLGIRPEHVAALVCGRLPPGETPFFVGGIDYTPILKQIVSSELDADRMDYLLRDSFYTGVDYGHYDHDWLIQNVVPIEQDGRMVLGITHRAAFAFEDFLLSRYHMFVSVYYHATCLNYEKLLARFFAESAGEYALGADPEAYVLADDVQLVSALRASRNEWARRIVERRGFHLLIESNPFEDEVDLRPVLSNLSDEGIDHFEAESLGVLSKYFRSEHGTSLLVRTARGEVRRIDDYTPLFQRYSESARLVRVYVDPDKRVRARALAGPLARR